MADPFSAWGAEESGARVAEQDQLALRQKNLQAQKLMGEIAMQPDEARFKRTHADLYEAQSKRYGRETAAAERLESAFQSADLPDNPIEALTKMTKLAAQSGNPTAALKMLEGIGTLNLKTAQAERATAQADLSAINGAVKKQDFISNRLAVAPDQASWNRENQLFENEFQEASPYKGMPFSPDLAKQVGEGALSAKDRLKRQTDDILEKGRNSRSAADRAIRSAANDIAQQRADTADRVATARVKAGGAARTPSLREQEATGVLLKEHLPDLDKDGRERATRDIASRANEIRGVNKGIGAAQAIQMAFKEFQEAGVFEQSGGVELPLVGTVGKKTKYSSGGMSRDTAIPLPRGSLDEVRKGLKKNRYYTTPRGLARWTGDAFESVDDSDDEDDE